MKLIKEDYDNNFRKEKSISFEQKSKECDLSRNGKCIHFYSDGELSCNGTKKEQGICMVYNEISI